MGLRKNSIKGYFRYYKSDQAPNMGSEVVNKIPGYPNLIFGKDNKGNPGQMLRCLAPFIPLC